MGRRESSEGLVTKWAIYLRQQHHVVLFLPFSSMPARHTSSSSCDRWRSGISLIPVPTYSFRYTLALVLTSAGAAAYLIITSWRLFLAWTGGIHDPHWEGVPVHEAAFVGAQCVAFFQMAVAVNRERQRGAFFHSPPMRCPEFSFTFPPS
jgi:hypothetical protein